MTLNQPFDLFIASCDKDGGIYNYQLTPNGQLLKKNFLPLANPMYIAEFDNLLYVVLRSPFGDDNSGFTCTTKDFKKTGKIIPTMGKVACHLYVSEFGRYAVNYISGSVIKMPDKVISHFGKSINKIRQASPHTHFVGITPDKNYICVTDLGTDKIYFYDHELNFRFDISVPEGNGARHLVFSDDGKFMYCANELSGTVSVFEYNGVRTQYIKDYSTVPYGYLGQNSVAAIRFNNGRVYVSNRGHDSIAVFTAAGNTLKLKEIFPVHGNSPRDFNIFGKFLICANELSDNVTLFDISGGKAKKLSQEITDIKTPLCII